MTPRLLASLLAHTAVIVAANVLTARLGLVPAGFGLLVTAGTFAAGLALVARDLVHRYGGIPWALASIALAGVISWYLSTPSLAIASVTAFLLAELADLAVYARLRRAGMARAVLASNTIAAPIDTVLFLALAGFPITAPVVLGQLVAKLLWGTLLPVTAGVLLARLRRA